MDPYDDEYDVHLHKFVSDTSLIVLNLEYEDLSFEAPSPLEACTSPSADRTLASPSTANGRPAIRMQSIMKMMMMMMMTMRVILTTPMIVTRLVFSDEYESG